MTEEELKQEAENNKPPYAFCALNTNCELWKDGYEKGAEPREKRIAELEDKLANADYQLEGRDLEIKELKAQIEKMKCCYNCDFVFRDGNCYYDKECKNKDHWKLKEIKEK